MDQTQANFHSAQFSAWLNQQFSDLPANLTGPLSLTPLAGDAGCRRYYRINSVPSLLAVDAPPQTEDSQAFVELGNFLRDNGIHTPNILAADTERGFLLVEDFGDQLLQLALNEETADLLYGESLMTLLRLQQCPKPTFLPDYTREFLSSELALFEQWFIETMLKETLNEDEKQQLQSCLEILLDSACDQPQSWVHRDYHSRNLMVTEGNAPGVVDFQGALYGPFTYDLVSLLKDCYIDWPCDQVKRWALAYGNMALEVGIIEPVGETKFMRWFDLMGLQRHLKVLGIFARLSLRDGKQGYLEDLPRVLNYVLEVCQNYPELEALQNLFEQKLMPAIEEQDWYKAL